MWVEAVTAFAVVFLAAIYMMSPKAPGREMSPKASSREAINTFVEARTPDQHFSGCDAARAAGRENIPSYDPSYREQMDGDGDGLACEPYY